MEIPTAALGIAVLVLAVAWMVAPSARWRILRFVSGAGLLLLLIAMMLAYSQSLR
ncbi:MAG: hypothetical protein JXA67_15010 [Micromonosporaceae bacterium]|nr:hypothetical protein [Micromonosporaceae bacterium]